MEIANPRRILAVSHDGSTQDLSRIIKELTGSYPEPASSTLAGTTHDLPLTTPYYKAQVPIWLDVISDPTEWAATFLLPEAKEVLQVVGGLVLVFTLPGSSPYLPSSGTTGTPVRPAPTKEETKTLISQVGRVVLEGLGGWDWDGVGLAIAVGDLDSDDPDALNEWEDACADSKLELIHVRGTASQRADEAEEKRNEYGEKMGIARVLEALQSNDWEGGAAAGSEEDDDDEFGFGDIDARMAQGSLADAGSEDGDGPLDPRDLGFGFDRADFEGMKKAIWDAGRPDAEPEDKAAKAETSQDDLEDDDVQQLERMFLKLQAVREQTSGLPEEQRKKMAKKAVTEVMKDL